MSDLMKPQLEVIRDRMNRATPGPWAWFGNTSVQHVYLATQRWGRHMVMTFQRWGMQNAQPAFFDRPTPTGVRESIAADATHQAAAEVPIFEVAPHARDAKDPAVYREDIVGLRNADATFIAHSRADVEWLVGEVDRLTALLTAGTPTQFDDKPQTLRLIGWSCRHEWNTPSHGQHMDWDHRKGKPVRRTNVHGSFVYASSWRKDEYRCPYSEPVYTLVDAAEVTA